LLSKDVGNGFFVGELLNVVRVIAEYHVDQGTDHKDENGRQQDREPQGKDGDHGYLLLIVGDCLDKMAEQEPCLLSARVKVEEGGIFSRCRQVRVACGRTTCFWRFSTAEDPQSTPG
jgi:hypothetical protein